MVISVQYEMSIMLTAVFQEPGAIALDFLMFKLTPVAFSYLRSDSVIAGSSVGSVTNKVMSSAYATVAVRVPLPTLILVSVWSKSYRGGFRHKTNSSILKGQPCLTPPCMGIAPVVCPLIWIDEYASSYILFIRAINLALNPYTSRTFIR